MKTLGAIAILICLISASCGYHDHYARRSEIRRAQEDLRRARQDWQREMRQAHEDFRREMRDAHREFRDDFDRW